MYVDANGQGLIKGNINSKGEKIYHLPDDPSYNKTSAEMWFKTESEAKDAGFRPIKR
jgi:methylphosphotriester-DNA--protein-cysteine methyltransferase